jgi:hypothetical protein
LDRCSGRFPAAGTALAAAVRTRNGPHSWICYLDLNGPENGGPKPYDPKSGHLAPVIVERARRLAKKLAVSDLRARFIDVATRRQLTGMPVKPDAAWKKLEAAIRQARK